MKDLLDFVPTETGEEEESDGDADEDADADAEVTRNVQVDLQSGKVADPPVLFPDAAADDE